MMFKNHGSAAGATLEHPHSQLIALPVVPRNVSEEMKGALDYFASRSAASSATSSRQELRERARLVYENADFVVMRAVRAQVSVRDLGAAASATARAFEDCARHEDFASLANALRGGAAQAARRARRPALQLHPAHRAVRRAASPVLPLAHRDHAEAEQGGRLRVGLGLLHQPDAARGGRRVPARDRPRRDAQSCTSPPRWRPSPRPAASPTCSARCPRALAALGHRGHGGDAALSRSIPSASAWRAGCAAGRRRSAPRPSRSACSRGRPPGGRACACCSSITAVVRSRRALRRRAAATIADNARRFALLGARGAGAGARSSAPGPTSCTATTGRPAPSLFVTQRCGDLRPPTTVFTIHNLAFQGLFPEAGRRRMALPRADLTTPTASSSTARLGFFKAGLALADRITTVSPRYAREIQTPEQGSASTASCARDADRAARDLERRRLRGVESGDAIPQLPRPIRPVARRASARCKAALQRELGLPLRADGAAVRIGLAAHRSEGLRPGARALLPPLPRERHAVRRPRLRRSGARRARCAELRRAVTRRSWRCASATTRRWRIASRPAATCT